MKRSRFLVALAVGAVLLAACSKKAPSAAGSSSLPAAAGVLSSGATTMAGVTSSHVTLKVDGPLSPLPIHSADGVIARGGLAKATAELSLGSALISYQVVETGGKLYLKGPTGGFSSLPVSSFYDVSSLLDPTTGVASLLSQATNGVVVGRESVEGVDTYKLTASVPTTVLHGLADLAPGQDRVTATLWIEVSGSHLVQAVVPLMISGSTKVTTVTADLSQFNAPVDITAPS